MPLAALVLAWASPASAPADVAVEYSPIGFQAGQCLPGASKLGPVGIDCHAWEGKEFSHLDQRIVVYEYSSYDELRIAYERENSTEIDPTLILYGFTMFRDGYCEINIIDPDVDFRPEVIGHEMLHCLHGGWHNNNPVGVTS